MAACLAASGLLLGCSWLLLGCCWAAAGLLLACSWAAAAAKLLLGCSWAAPGLTGETKVAKVTKTKTTAKKDTKSAAAAPTEDSRRNVCALHAAGYCRFGTRCRNTHIGEAGSDEARRAYSEAQKGKAKGQEKGSKGDGKGKKGKKGDSKASKGGTGTPAAVAAAASTVTITEVEGKQAQKTWQSFCKFCDKALPSLNTFLKLSVPILATLISSITNSYEMIGGESSGFYG